MSQENAPPGNLGSGSQNLISVPAIEPLTRGNYKRLPAIELLIREIIVLESTGLIARARQQNKTSPEFLPPEVLVYFFRRAHKLGDKSVRDSLLSELANRCAQHLQGKMAGFSPALQDDMRQEVINKVIEDLLNPDDRSDFAQVCFWRYFKYKYLDVCDRHNKDRNVESLDAGWDSDREEQSETKLYKLPDHRLSPEQYVFLKNALESLPSDLRKLFFLAHYLKIQVESKNPNEITLSKHFGVTGRTIRTRLGKAKEYLTRYLEDV